MLPLTTEFIRTKIHFRNPESHKGDYGHALFVGGSLGKIGAAILASKACMRTGVGLLTSYVPAGAKYIFPTAIPEAMTLFDNNKDEITSFPSNTEKYTAIGIGCGLGISQLTACAFENWIKTQPQRPIVFDADALNLFSQNKSLLEFVPQNSIFTPHIREFERLVGTFSSLKEQTKKALKFAEKYTVFVVLKSHRTKIFCPNGTIFENIFGNAGMATAGSGDVLTGILLGLLSQGIPQEDACKLGVYIHGLAGDIALEEESQESLLATDIIKNIGRAFKKIYSYNMK